MKKRNHPPLAIFGIHLKSLLTVLVFLVVLLSLFNPLEVKQSIKGVFETTERQSVVTSPAETPENEINATPEMISKAARELRERRISTYESGQETSGKINYYLVNLVDGGSIEAESISIKPDQVTVITAQGIETVIPRTNIRNIIRLKLDPKPSQEIK